MQKIVCVATLMAISFFADCNLCQANSVKSADVEAPGVSLPRELQQMSRYNYEFRWLPSVASQVPLDMAEVAFASPDFMNDFSIKRQGYLSPFDNADITITVEKVGDNNVYVWQLPEPKEAPNCRFIAFVPRDGGRGYRVFTLEKSIMDPWVIGEAGGDKIHSNFGAESKDVPTATDFVKLLKKRNCLKIDR